MRMQQGDQAANCGVIHPDTLQCHEVCRVSCEVRAPFCWCRFHPDDDKQNVIMAGCGDKKIYQWDSDTGDLVQVGLTPVHCSQLCSKLSCLTPALCRKVDLHVQIANPKGGWRISFLPCQKAYSRSSGLALQHAGQSCISCVAEYSICTVRFAS